MDPLQKLETLRFGVQPKNFLQFYKQQTDSDKDDQSEDNENTSSQNSEHGQQLDRLAEEFSKIQKSDTSKKIFSTKDFGKIKNPIEQKRRQEHLRSSLQQNRKRNNSITPNHFQSQLIDPAKISQFFKKPGPKKDEDDTRAQLDEKELKIQNIIRRENSQPLGNLLNSSLVNLNVSVQQKHNHEKKKTMVGPNFVNKPTETHPRQSTQSIKPITRPLGEKPQQEISRLPQSKFSGLPHKNEQAEQHLENVEEVSPGKEAMTSPDKNDLNQKATLRHLQVLSEKTDSVRLHQKQSGMQNSMQSLKAKEDEGDQIEQPTIRIGAIPGTGADSPLGEAPPPREEALLPPEGQGAESPAGLTASSPLGSPAGLQSPAASKGSPPGFNAVAGSPAGLSSQQLGGADFGHLMQVPEDSMELRGNMSLGEVSNQRLLQQEINNQEDIINSPVGSRDLAKDLVRSRNLKKNQSKEENPLNQTSPLVQLTKQGSIQSAKASALNHSKKESIPVEEQPLLISKKTRFTCADFIRWLDHSKRKVKKQKWYIKSSNSYLCGWQTCVTLLSFASAYYYAFMAIFIEDGTYQTTSADTLDWCLIILFSLDVLLAFFVEQHLQPVEEEQDQQTPPPSKKKTFRLQFTERSIRKIALIRVKSFMFWFDVLTIIPFFSLFRDKMDRSSLLLLIKSLRIVKGFPLFNLVRVQTRIRSYLNSRLQKKAEQHQVAVAIKEQKSSKDSKEEFCGCSVVHHSVMTMLCTLHSLVVLVLVVGSFAFFWGLALLLQQSLEDPQVKMIHDDREPSERLLIAIYFSMTTLTTVGNGDYTPRTLGQASLVIGIMACALVIFAYTLRATGVLYRKIYLEGEESSSDEKRLEQFFAVLKKFNSNRGLPLNFKRRLTNFFLYQWEESASRLHESSLIKHMPSYLQEKVYRHFVYKDTLTTFKRFFEIKKGIEQSSICHSYEAVNLSQGSYTFVQNYFSWKDEAYSEFMIGFLSMLEPRQFENGHIILNNLEEVSEFYLISQGATQVGYFNEASLSDSSRNEPKHIYPLRYEKGHAFAIFEILFNIKSRFFYKAADQGEKLRCLAIRRNNWKKLQSAQDRKASSDYADLIAKFQKKVLIDFLNRTYFLIQDFQEELKVAKQDHEQCTDIFKSHVHQEYGLLKLQPVAQGEEFKEETSKHEEQAQGGGSATLTSKKESSQSSSVIWKLFSKMIISGNQVKEKYAEQTDQRTFFTQGKDSGNIWRRKIKDKDVNRIVRLQIPLAQFRLMTKNKSRRMSQLNQSDIRQTQDSKIQDHQDLIINILQKYDKLNAKFVDQVTENQKLRDRIIQLERQVAFNNRGGGGQAAEDRQINNRYQTFEDPQGGNHEEGHGIFSQHGQYVNDHSAEIQPQVTPEQIHPPQLPFGNQEEDLAQLSSRAVSNPAPLKIGQAARPQDPPSLPVPQIEQPTIHDIVASAIPTETPPARSESQSKQVFLAPNEVHTMSQAHTKEPDGLAPTLQPTPSVMDSACGIENPPNLEMEVRSPEIPKELELEVKPKTSSPEMEIEETETKKERVDGLPPITTPEIKNEVVKMEELEVSKEIQQPKEEETKAAPENVHPKEEEKEQSQSSPGMPPLPGVQETAAEQVPLQQAEKSAEADVDPPVKTPGEKSLEVQDQEQPRKEPMVQKLFEPSTLDKPAEEEKRNEKPLNPSTPAFNEPMDLTLKEEVKIPSPPVIEESKKIDSPPPDQNNSGISAATFTQPLQEGGTSNLPPINQASEPKEPPKFDSPDLQASAIDQILPPALQQPEAPVSQPKPEGIRREVTLPTTIDLKVSEAQEVKEEE